MNRQLPNDACWAVEGGLVAGPYAGAEFEEGAVRKICDLVAAGVTHFLDLTEVGALNHFGVGLRPYESILRCADHQGRCPTSYRRMEIQDMSVSYQSEMRRMLDHISAGPMLKQAQPFVP